MGEFRRYFKTYREILTWASEYCSLNGCEIGITRTNGQWHYFFNTLDHSKVFKQQGIKCLVLEDGQVMFKPTE